MSELNIEDISSLKVNELKEQLKIFGLKRSGTKKELIKRLKVALLYENSKVADDDELSDDDVLDNDDEGKVSQLSSASDNETDNPDASKSKQDGAQPFISFKDVEESIASFSGDDKTVSITSWLQEFNGLSELCHWCEVQKIVYARRLLKGSAALFIKHEKHLKSWKDMSTALRKEFTTEVSSKVVHKELAGRKKFQNESLKEYYYKMLDIASKCKIDKKSVMQYIIDGIDDDEASKTILYGAITYNEFRNKLNMYDEMKNNSLRTRPDYKSKRDENNMKEKNSTAVSAVGNNYERKRRCFNCGSKQHVLEECPDKTRGPKCFKCNNYGHISSKCLSTCYVKSKSEAVADDGKPTLNVKISSLDVNALLDSGSDLTLLQLDEYEKLGSPKLTSTQINLQGLGTNLITTIGAFSSSVLINDNFYDLQIHVVPNFSMRYTMILGRNFLKQVSITLQGNYIKEIIKIESVPDIYNINISDSYDKVETEIPGEVEKIVNAIKPVESKQVGVKLKLILVDEVPVYQRPRRLSPKHQDIVDLQIKKWLDDSIIRPSTSDYASPIVIVEKKNGEARICVDYRELNKKVIKERYPLPLIEDQIDALQGGNVFTTLDLKDGFFHVPIHEDSCKYTAFIVPNGIFEFLRAPFGLCNSPAVFQKYINAVFKDLIAKGVMRTYLDDIIIPSKDKNENIQKLKLVLERIIEFGLKINWKKCNFFKESIDFLGMVISHGKVEPSPQKIKAVVNFPKPRDTKSLQSFLGLAGYFRKFIRSYAMVARPLSDLLKKDVKFIFGPEEEEAFQRLKVILTNKPVLRLYQPNAETELHTDASKFGYGMILLQRDCEDNQFHPVYFASGKTTPAEQKYISYELEVLAIVKGLKKFRIYLQGIPFRIVTDCQAFQLTLKKKDLSVRIARWALMLESYQFEVVHRSGSGMRHVDSLSRYPLPELLYIEQDDGEFLASLKKAQDNDEEIRVIIKNLNDKSTFKMRKDILYKEENDELLFVVPRCMQEEIILRAHNRGHFSVEKTMLLLKKDYYFPKMKEKVERIIKNCVSCILAQKKAGKKEGFLHCLDKGDRPLETYHIDHVGPLSPTKKKYNHILVVVDSFTKFVWLYPTKSTGTEEVLVRLKRQAAIFGNPARIITDRGTAFSSSQFGQYCEEERIKHILITTGVPRGNGQVERMNKLVVPLITKLSHPTPDNWWKHVDFAQQIINSTPTRSTGTTPFQLLTGVEMKLKNDIDFKNLIEQQLVCQLQDERDELRRIAKQNILKLQSENRKYYNRKRKKATTYKIGDLVAIKRMQPSSKFHTSFLGPYEVTGVSTNERYKVHKIGCHEGPNVTTTAAEFMKPWRQYDPIYNVDDYSLITSSDEGDLLSTLQDDEGDLVSTMQDDEGDLVSTMQDDEEDLISTLQDDEGDLVSTIQDSRDSQNGGPISSRTRNKSGRPIVGCGKGCPACR